MSKGILSKGDFVLVYNMIVSQIIPGGLCPGGILSTIIYFKNPLKINYKEGDFVKRGFCQGGILSMGDFILRAFVQGDFGRGDFVRAPYQCQKS